MLPILLSLLAFCPLARACTAVDLVAADRSVIAGRTMEWAFDMKWTLVSSPKGASLTLPAVKSAQIPARTVETPHAYVGVGAGILPAMPLVEGQNDAGLGMSGNFLPGFTQYQSVAPGDDAVEILSFGAFALGRFDSVAALRAALPRLKVWSDPEIGSGPTAPLMHFIFTDRSGDGMVVEYVGGRLEIHDNLAHVLTNAPSYDWHLTNLRNYLNLTTIGVDSRAIGSVDVTALGQGGGLTGLPGDYTPPARFVRAAFLRHALPQPKDAAEAREAVAHVLNTVDIPIGAAQSRLPDGTLVSDYTQWVNLKDLSHDHMAIADYDHRLGFLDIDLGPVFAADHEMSRPVADLPYGRAKIGVEAFAP